MHIKVQWPKHIFCFNFMIFVPQFTQSHIVINLHMRAHARINGFASHNNQLFAQHFVSIIYIICIEK